ncbi:MAG: hypothetical protein V4560_07935 [Bacteroidota bacterium]
MKRIVLSILIVVIGHCITMAQTIKSKEVKNSDLTYVLNSIQKTTHYNDEKNSLFIKVYVVADPSGSAHTEGTDEITNSIYIAVSNDGEWPEQHLFRLTSVYNPKLVNWVKTATGPGLVLTYGAANKTKKVTIQVALKQLVIR